MSWVGDAWDEALSNHTAKQRGQRGQRGRIEKTKQNQHVVCPQPVPNLSPLDCDRGHYTRAPGTEKTQEKQCGEGQCPRVPAVPAKIERVRKRAYDPSAPLWAPQPERDPLDLRAAEVGFAYGLPNEVARAFVVLRDGAPAPGLAEDWPTLMRHVLKRLSAAGSS